MALGLGTSAALQLTSSYLPPLKVATISFSNLLAATTVLMREPTSCPMTASFSLRIFLAWGAEKRGRSFSFDIGSKGQRHYQAIRLPLKTLALETGLAQWMS